MDIWQKEVKEKKRFEFGKNWLNYRRIIDDDIEDDDIDDVEVNDDVEVIDDMIRTWYSCRVVCLWCRVQVKARNLGPLDHYVYGFGQRLVSCYDRY